MNTLYTKDGIKKARNSIVINKKNKQIINPTHDMLIADGWKLYVEPQLTDEELLLHAKEALKQRIINYGESDNVDQFFVNGIGLWLDKTKRSGLILRLNAEQAKGLTHTTLWEDGHPFDLTIEKGFQLLYALELYASACFDNTQRHIAAAKSLATVAECESYDFTTGYPEKLNIEL